MKLTKLTLQIITCCGLAALFTGCASIMCGPKQAVTFDSRPTGAEVLVYDSRGDVVFRQNTPCIATLKRREHDYLEGAKYVVLVRKEGYAPVQFPLNGVVNRAYYANILNAGIGYGVDPVTGSMWTLNPESKDVEMVSAYSSFFKQDGLLVSLQEQGGSH